MLTATFTFRCDKCRDHVTRKTGMIAPDEKARALAKLEKW